MGEGWGEGGKGGRGGEGCDYCLVSVSIGPPNHVKLISVDHYLIRGQQQR